MEADKPSV
jgi:hypothetical protein